MAGFRAGEEGGDAGETFRTGDERWRKWAGERLCGGNGTTEGMREAAKQMGGQFVRGEAEEAVSRIKGGTSLGSTGVLAELV